MTTQEFSAAFDTLLNSYNSKASFGETSSKTEIVLDEYEKSVFLTQAQDIIIKSYFNKNTNPQGEGIDDSTRRQVDFSSLITVKSCAVDSSSSIVKFDTRGTIFKAPDDLLVILNEKCTIGSKNYVVVPINYGEYDRLMTKAYSQPLKKQCWRLFHTSGTTLYSEVIPNEKDSNITEYKVRYVKRPAPIILVDLNFTNQESLEVGGKKSISECTLNPIVHADILNKAFELAIISKTGNLPKIEQ